jgi:hypothetical protein
VDAAFLEGDLDEAIYIEWHEGVLDLGFETGKTVTENEVHLWDSTSGPQFFKKMVQHFTTIGVQQSKVDPCIF